MMVIEDFKNNIRIQELIFSNQNNIKSVLKPSFKGKLKCLMTHLVIT
jgi:hypothetical protein